MLTWIRSPQSQCRRFIFLDRDGVINSDSPDYIKRWDEFLFYPEALEALRLLKGRGVEVILISNQSGLGRGLTDWDDFWDLHERMIARIREEGGDLLAAYYCPHLPEQGCACRKPLPGMLLAASKLFHIPISETFMAGDKATDVEAANNAGCRSIHIRRTLFEREETRDRPPTGTDPSLRAPDGSFGTLSDAVRAVFGG